MIEVLRKLLRHLTSSSETLATGRVYPDTLRRGSNDPRVIRPQVFDPALKQFSNAFRLGEPQFHDLRLSAPWYEARQKALAHLLRLMVNSSLGDMVVLRGSMLLKAWYGERARRPGDIDWVVLPGTLRYDDAPTSDLFQEFLERVDENRDIDSIHFLVDQIRTDPIWTYERAKGIRILFPYMATDLPVGEVFMDFVFDEPLPAPPIRATLPDLGRADISVLAASKELSLVWKLIWLTTDMYPQAKDLYDAVLLAEDPGTNMKVVSDLLFSLHPQLFGTLELQIRTDEWDALRAEYPLIQGRLEEWTTRINAIIRQMMWR